MATYRFRTVSRVDTCPIEKEANSLYVFALTITECVHEFGELGGPLDFEKDLVVVVCHLDVEMFGLGLFVGVASRPW